MAQKKILFIDDEPVVLTLMKNRLISRDFLVETATDGVMGLTKAKAWLPDLILLDIAMPGQDGYETCRSLKESRETESIPVVLFTAMQDAQLEVLAKSVGAAKVVRKPFVDQVFQAIDEILGPQ
jgi:two-component system alkaline phosphatase synthesis response regulator PhoP